MFGLVGDMVGGEGRMMQQEAARDHSGVGEIKRERERKREI